MEAVLSYDRAVRSSLGYLQALLGSLPLGEIAVRLWDGTVWKNSSRPRCTLVLRHPGALRRMFWPAGRHLFTESYLSGDFEVEGNLEEGITLADCLFEVRWGIADKLRLTRHLLGLPGSAGGTRVKAAVSRPVSCRDDFPVDFFRLWLGNELFSSCGRFGNPNESLEAAQARKLEHLCRDLHLQTGERLLELGCGWGTLVLHAARHTGVLAHGVTASQGQAEFAAGRVRAAGLAGVCRVDAVEPLDLGLPHCYDKLVSIGLLDPVRESCLPAYFAQAWRLLRPGGVFLYQGISGNLANPLQEGSFLEQHLFPEGSAAPIADVLRIAEMTGFEIRDLDNLREHGTLTVRNWLRRLEENRTEAIGLIGEADFRLWHLCLASAAHGFRTGRLQLYQALLVKPEFEDSHLPLLNSDKYH